jgi:putative tryptophan/tyrosine transport system substrate-binding protein
MSPELDGKRQDILIEAIPGAQRVAVLVDANVATLKHLEDLEASARAHRKELVIVRAASANDLISAMNEASGRGVGGFNVLSSPMLHLNRGLIIERAAKLRLPAIFQWPETAEEGGLLGYGPSFIEVFRERARLVAKVLRGANPADLPIEQPSKFNLVINLKTAKAINYTLPSDLVLRADKVVE